MNVQPILNAAKQAFTFQDLYIVPKFGDIESRKDVDVSTKLGKHKLNLPIVLSNMRHVSDLMAARVSAMGGLVVLQHDRDLKGLVRRYKDINDYINDGRWLYDRFIQKKFDQHKRELTEHEHYIAIDQIRANYKPNPEGLRLTFGIGPNNYADSYSTIDLISGLVEECGIKTICLDTANGYMKKFLNLIDTVCSNFPDLTIIAGNIITREALTVYNIHHVDVAKVGLGSGNACSTRKQTGVGTPQATALYHMSDHPGPIQVMSDGGVKAPRDLCIALGLGASTVMIGSLYARCIESQTPGKFGGSANDSNHHLRTGQFDILGFNEGLDLNVENNDDCVNVTHNLISGLRSSMSYVGARTLDEYRERISFGIQSTASYIEGVKTLNE